MPEESENRLTEDEVALNEQSKISFLDPSEFPRVEELQGQVSVYESKNNSFLPLQFGFEITEPTLFVVGEESELIISFPGQVASRIGANSRLVVSPRINNRYEIELRLGTISAMLDPSRNVIELQFL